MHVSADTLVADAALADPRVQRLFDRLGIDYWCGGRRRLADACRQRALPVDAVIGQIATATARARDADQRHWTLADVPALVEHITATHHARLRCELPRLEEILLEVNLTHRALGGRRLGQLWVEYKTLRVDLEQHLAKEEQALFPVVISMWRCAQNGRPSPVPSGVVGGPIGTVEAEHAHIDARMRNVHELTQGFEPPEWACAKMRGLWRDLARFVADARTGMHLENNLLHEQARELDRLLTSHA